MFVANKDFDNFVGVDKEYIDSNEVKRDLANLKEKSEYIEEYADKMIAHLDDSEIKELPSYIEVKECLEFFKNIIKKYLVLIHGISDDFEPNFLHDWKKIFRYPWIEKDCK